jgi:hypothetical protein
VSATAEPPHAVAELLIRNPNRMTQDEREALSHVLRYHAVRFALHGDEFPDGDFSFKVADVTQLPEAESD